MLKSFFIVVAAVFFTLILFAGAVDNNMNYSAEYLRTLSRNATIDSADAAVYNPAGLAFLPNGIYIGFSNQVILKEYRITTATDEYKADNPIVFFPGANIIYRKDKWTVYTSFHISGNGGALEYDEGLFLPPIQEIANPSFDSSKPESQLNPKTLTLDAPVNITNKAVGTTEYVTLTFGGAYKVSEQISISAGIRYTSAKKSSKLKVSGNVAGKLTTPFGTQDIPIKSEGDILQEYERSSSGISGVFGIHYQPVDKLNIGLRYESKVDLRWTFDKSVNYRYNKGDKYYRDLPPIIGLGISYKLLPEFKTEFSTNIYLNTQANWDKDLNGDYIQDTHDNGYDFALSFEYSIANWMKTSIGGLYTKTGADSDSYYYANAALENYAIGGGFWLSPIESFEINFGVEKIFYTSDNTNVKIKDNNTGQTLYEYKADLSKKATLLALGVQYKF